MSTVQLDRAGRPVRDQYRTGAPPNKGKQYPPAPPAAGQILQVVEMLGDDAQSLRLAALIVVLWRGGLGLSEALALDPTDFNALARTITVRAARKAAQRRASMDVWACDRLTRWQRARRDLPAGPLFCVLRGPTIGQNWQPAGARSEITRLGKAVGIKQFKPQQLRYAHALELLQKGVPLPEAYRQLGLSLARNNRAPALLALSKRGPDAGDVLKPPAAEKQLRSAGGMAEGGAYSLTRRAAQAADNSYRNARTLAAKSAWNDALSALHEAEQKMLLAAAEEYGAAA